MIGDVVKKIKDKRQKKKEANRTMSRECLKRGPILFFWFLNPIPSLPLNSKGKGVSL
jgi:hypothetical protein